MASMRRLNRRLLRWRRYAAKVGGGSYYRRIGSGLRLAWLAVQKEQERRFWDDPYAGYGPCYCLGCIGSGRCEHEDPEADEFFCGDPGCSCGDEPDDDAGHGDDWPPGVVSVPDISEWRLP